MYHLIQAEFPFWIVLESHEDLDVLTTISEEYNQDGLTDIVDDIQLESIKIKYPQHRSIEEDD